MRQLATGHRSGDEIELVSAVSEDNSVAVARASGLTDGQPVKIIVP